MKKIVLIAFISVAAIFAAIPSFAQETVRQKADKINSAEKQAAQSNSASEARGIGDSVWTGAEQGDGALPTEPGKTIDVISDNEDSLPQENPSNFDKPKTKDVTPWKGLLIALCATFMSGIAFLIATFILAETMRNAVVSDTAWKIVNMAVTGLLIAALLAFIASIAMATVIMIKYKQFMLGGIWLGASVLLLAFVIETIRRAFFGKGITSAVSAVGSALSLFGIGGGAFLMAKPETVADKGKH